MKTEQSTGKEKKAISWLKKKDGLKIIFFQSILREINFNIPQTRNYEIRINETRT